jgi:hypothetical protein
MVNLMNPIKNRRAIRLVGIIALAVCLIIVQAVFAQAENQAPATSVGSATTLAACPAGCACMTDAMAIAKFGSYTRCSNTVCGYDTASVTAQNGVEKAVNARYCVRQVTAVTPEAVCPANCRCMSEADANEKGYVPCNGVQKVCGYQSLTGNSAETSRTQALYCYSKPSPAACTAGCSCMTEEQAKEKFGSYTRCSNAPCMNTPTTTSAQVSYCFRQTSEQQVEVPYVKPVRCICTCQENTGKAALDINNLKSPEKTACTCTCGGSSMNTGTSTAPVTAGYPACTGTCGDCSYDYKLGTCAGSCTDSGAACQLNTVRNNPDGTVAYAECHCKQRPDTLLQPVATPYVISASCNSTAGICKTSEGVQLSAVKIEPAGEVSRIVEQKVATASPQSGTAGNAGEPGGLPGTPPQVSGGNHEEVPERTEIQATPDIVRSIGNIIRSFFGLAVDQQA